MVFKDGGSGFCLPNRILCRALVGVLGLFALSCNSTSTPSVFDAVLEASRETEIRLLGRVPETAVYREKIGVLAQEVEKRCLPSLSPTEKIFRLNTFLFEEWGLVADTVGKDVGSSCLTRVLDERRGSCVGITALYLCLGERLNLPLHAVLVSGHVFVRLANNGNPWNIETLRKGIMRSDSFYAEYFCEQEKAACIRNLSTREFIGVCYFNLGNAYRKSGFYEDAVLKYEQALAWFPEFREAKENAKQTRKTMAYNG